MFRPRVAPNLAFCLLVVGLSSVTVGCGDNAAPTPTAGAAPTASASTTASAASPGPSSSAAPATSSAAAPKPPTNGAKGPFPQSTHAAMKDPTKAKLTAPDTFEGQFETTAGDFVVKCTRSWAPHAADRFYNLLKIGFYNDVAIYRVHPGFVAQFGLHGDPAISGMWQKSAIEPDIITKKNKAGTITFAQAGNPEQKGKTALTRATQVFINYSDNDHLDGAFAPVCKITKGLEVTKTFGGDKLHRHLKMAQGRIIEKGNDFLRKMYPELDYIKRAFVVGEDPDAAPDTSAAPATSGSAAPKAPPTKPGKPTPGKLVPEP